MHLNRNKQRVEEGGQEAPVRQTSIGSEKDRPTSGGKHFVKRSNSSLISEALRSTVVFQLSSLSDVGILFVIFSLVVLAGPTEFDTLQRLLPGVIPIIVAPLIAWKLAEPSRRQALSLFSIGGRLLLAGALIFFINHHVSNSTIFIQIGLAILALGLFHNTSEITACNTASGPVHTTFLKGICLASTATSLLVWLIAMEFAEGMFSPLQTLFLCSGSYVLALIISLAFSQSYETKRSGVETKAKGKRPKHARHWSNAPTREDWTRLANQLPGSEAVSLLLLELVAYALLILPALMFVTNGPFFHVARDLEFRALLAGWLLGALGTTASIVRWSHMVTAIPTTLLLQLGIIAGNLGLILTSSSYLTPLLLFNLGLASASLIVSTQLQLSAESRSSTIYRVLGSSFTVLSLTGLFVYLCGLPTVTSVQPYIKLSSLYLLISVALLVLSKRNCNSLVRSLMSIFSPPLIGEHDYPGREGRNNLTEYSPATTTIYTTSRLSVRTAVSTGLRLNSLVVIYSDEWLWTSHVTRPLLQWLGIFVISDFVPKVLPRELKAAKSITVHSNVAQLQTLLADLEIKEDAVKFCRVSVSDTRRVMFAMRCLTVSRISPPSAQAPIPHTVQ